MAMIIEGSLNFWRPYMSSIFVVTAVKTIPIDTPAVALKRIADISNKPVSYILNDKNVNRTSLLPLLKKGKNKAKRINGISIVRRFRYVFKGIWEYLTIRRTISPWEIIWKGFVTLENAIERTIKKVASILDWGLNL